MSELLQAEADEFKTKFEQAKAEVAKLIIGQARVVEATLTALICGGNVLLEGVPGLGKTELVKALSQVLDLNFNRIQFTPDLMPADIIGTNMMTNDANGNYQFEFRQGPIFTQLLLADEINRATPKTQSALLETMQEGSVTTGGKTYQLDPPFFILATQNPLEQEGTYPLPEAQLDRFMFKVYVDFPSKDELFEIVNLTTLKSRPEVQSVLNSEKILALRDTLDKVVVAENMVDYAVRLILSTHPESDYASHDVKSYIRWGASPRATQALIHTARVHALASGRLHVSFADIRHYATEILQHRLILNYDAQAEGIEVSTILQNIFTSLEEVPAQ
jgi:MoxR-like ATPase